MNYAGLIYWASIILLVINDTLGKVTNGARSWIAIGNRGIQPSEFAKILFILTYGTHLEKVKSKINSPKSILGLLLHAGIVIGMVFLQKDLGMAIVFTVVFTVMTFAAGVSLWYCAAGVGLAIAASPFIWRNLNEYQQKRILVGFNPELDPLHYGWQVIKSKTAIGAGGLFGVGFGKGSIAQSKTFPAKQTDMIFAVVGEEAGLIGALCVLTLLFLLTLKIIHTGTVSRDQKGMYICAGIAGMIMFQVIENVGMCLGFMPVIGITLPFVSYGGSSVLSLYLAMGILMSIYSHKDIYYSRRQ
jgi:rod shape determining protein RodA